MLRVAWTGMFAGVASGAMLGLFFHRENWMGGYNSYRRRLARLGHISFFGLAFVNLAFAVSVFVLPVNLPLASWAAGSFILGAVTMPLCCFLSAWRKPFRHLFPIPVAGVATGIILTLILCLN